MEEGACVTSSSPLEDNRLGPAVCAPLAQQRLNLTFFTHVAGDREVLCTASHNGEAALTLLQSQADPAASLALQPGTSILAVYPHDKRPEVIGTFIKSLARARVVIHGLASSPSAISVVLSSPRIKPAVEQLFEHFTFPGFASPEEFFSAQAPPKEYLEKVVATYQEKVNKVYWIIPQPDLDLWGMSIGSGDILAGFAAALMEMGQLGLVIPFLVALPGLGGQEFILSFSTARRQPGGGDQGSEVRRILKQPSAGSPAHAAHPGGGHFSPWPPFRRPLRHRPHPGGGPGKGPYQTVGPELHHFQHFPDHSPARTGRGPAHPGEHLCGPGGMRPGRTDLTITQGEGRNLPGEPPSGRF